MLKKGNAIFTQPFGLIKCAGAPQKAMYLSEEIFRKNNVRKDINIEFISGAPSIFSSPKYANTLTEIYKSKNINASFNHDLIEIDSENKIAIFKTKEGIEIPKPYDFIHVSPKMQTPDFIRNNPKISNEAGFVNVDKYTTQYLIYKNIFSIGDCSSLPTSKTAAAISKQSPYCFHNILCHILNEGVMQKYEGYTACPIPVGNQKLLLCEFDYTLEPTPTIKFLDPLKPRTLYFYLKKNIFPSLYWDYLLKGLWTYDLKGK